MDLLRHATPPLEDDLLAHPRSPVVPASQSSGRSNTPIAGPSQPSTSNASQASRASQASTVRQRSLPLGGQGSRAREVSRSPTPLPRLPGSRSPTPIEIETQDSVIVIETQESQVEIIRSPSPAPANESAGVECGCCFTETEIVSSFAL